MLKKLFKYGELPTLKTSVAIDGSSLAQASIALFLAGFLIVLAYFSIQKLSK